MKNLHFELRWVLEWQCNPYKNVSREKKRLILVWTNKSKWFRNKIFGFYCSTKVDEYNNESCVKIDKETNSSFKKDTYVWLHKPMVINNNKIIKNSWKTISNPNVKTNIKSKIKQIYNPLFGDDNNSH